MLSYMMLQSSNDSASTAALQPVTSSTDAFKCKNVNARSGRTRLTNSPARRSSVMQQIGKSRGRPEVPKYALRTEPLQAPQPSVSFAEATQVYDTIIWAIRKDSASKHRLKRGDSCQ